MAVKSGHRQNGFTGALSIRYPGLLEKIQTLIIDAERAFADNAPESDGSFLWEHTVHVAGLAFKLAVSEKQDPALAAIVALFHDAGKFAGGLYHEGEVAEEEYAAGLAEVLLPKVRMKATERKAITAALRALYHEQSEKTPIADIVHDADFLSKFGYLGVAAFFTKAALRGRLLRDTLVRSLSKELTYAANLPLNMRTQAARALAERKAADSLSFYRSFLTELRDVHDLDFAVITRLVRPPRRPSASISIRLVLPRRCEACGGRWRVESETSPGLKCEKLEAQAVCRGCGATHDLSFCLPELQA